MHTKLTKVPNRKTIAQISFNKGEAFQRPDVRRDEKADDIHEKARIFITGEDLPKAATAVLISQREAIEMNADSCEEDCDQIKIIMIRR